MTDNANTPPMLAASGPTADTDMEQAEREYPMLRGMRLAREATARRWKAYGLPAVTPLASFADYAEASTKRRELAITRSKIEADLTSARTEIARGFAARHDDATERQAQDILDGRPEEAFAHFEVLNQRVSRLTQRSNGYARAIGIQDERVAMIRAERSIDAAESMEPTHRAIVTAIADACEQLRLALDREDAIRSAVTEAGFDARLPTFASPRLTGQGGALEELEHRAREYAR